MWRPGIAISLLAALALTGCQHLTAPASVAGGECKIFSDPGFRVLGATAIDQRWIAVTQETGIRSCHWRRPAQRQVLPAVSPLPAPTAVEAPPLTAEPAPAAPWWRRWMKS